MLAAVKFYNTRSRKKEIFKPYEEGKVRLYVCGITAYDHCHIGHARAAVVFDVLVRFLRYLGYEVTYVKNYTDIDDKIIDRAQRENSPVGEVAERFIAEHDRVMELLGVERPTYTPRATEHISEMISFIERLIDKGVAYVSNGDVYFAVDRFPFYGALSGRSPEELLAGARVEINERKGNPLDFALWKASKEGEPFWESPWGRGRPGWHIECSVMSEVYLGPAFDIHGGGEDLIFPHHENEVAQSQAKNGTLPARYWLHNGFVRINREKMSKSLGNIFNIKDVLEEYHPEVLRLFLLSGHYRSPLDFSWESLGETRVGLRRLYSALEGIDTLLTEAPLSESLKEEKQTELSLKIAEGKASFLASLADDLNTARALGVLFDLARYVNALGQKKPEPTPELISSLKEMRSFFRESGGILGILKEEPARFLADERRRSALKAGLDLTVVERLVAERWEAKRVKNWQKADEIREQLGKMGVSIQDGKEGSTWTVDEKIVFKT